MDPNTSNDPSNADIAAHILHSLNPSCARYLTRCGFQFQPGFDYTLKLESTWVDPDILFDNPTPVVYDPAWAMPPLDGENRAWGVRLTFTIIVKEEDGEDHITEPESLAITLPPSQTLWEEKERSWINLLAGGRVTAATTATEIQTQGGVGKETVQIPGAAFGLPIGTGPGEVTIGMLDGEEVVCARRHETPFVIEGLSSERAALVAMWHATRGHLVQEREKDERRRDIAEEEAMRMEEEKRETQRMMELEKARQIAERKLRKNARERERQRKCGTGRKRMS